MHHAVTLGEARYTLDVVKEVHILSMAYDGLPKNWRCVCLSKHYSPIKTICNMIYFGLQSVLIHHSINVSLENVKVTQKLLNQVP